MNIRRANPVTEELIALYELLSGMHSEAGLNFPPIDPVKTMVGIQRCFDTGGVWVAEQDGLKGALGVFRNELWFSLQPILGDMFFYVHPDARKSSAARKLLKIAKEFATAEGLPLYIGILNANDLDRKDAFMRLHKFRRVGAIYVLFE